MLTFLFGTDVIGRSGEHEPPAEEPVVVGDEFSCTKLTNEIMGLGSINRRDATVHDTISKLIAESEEKKLECAGRLAAMRVYISDKNAETIRVIEANIRANRCDAARELAMRLTSTGARMAQRSKVVSECMSMERAGSSG